MPRVTLRLEGDGAFEDVLETAEEIIYLTSDEFEMRVAALESGMQSGAPSIAFGFQLPDGKYVIFDTSLKIMLTTLEAIVARYGDPR